MSKHLSKLLDQTYIVDSVNRETKITTSPNIIKVIGVGGGGSNAVNYMYNKIKDVDFVVCNTDRQALLSSQVPTKLQLGPNLTKGLGAGTLPKNGEDAAMESLDEIKSLIDPNTQMVFITAGMGGGTGTGAAPIIAKTVKEMGMLTVAVVTAPYSWEGTEKREQALKGIKELQDSTDTVLVVLNEKLEELYEDMRLSEAFAQADNILLNAVKSISEIITTNGNINTDFNDVKRVLLDAGQSVMGMSEAEGDDRAEAAIKGALDSPLLNDNDIAGAERILVTLASSRKNEARMREQRHITSYVRSQIQGDADMFKLGTIIDDTLGDKLRVTIVAAGFESLKTPIDLPEGDKERLKKVKKQSNEEIKKAQQEAEAAERERLERERIREEERRKLLAELGLSAEDVNRNTQVFEPKPIADATPTSSVNLSNTTWVVGPPQSVQVPKNVYKEIPDTDQVVAGEWSAEENQRIRTLIQRLEKSSSVDWELLSTPAYLRNKVELWEHSENHTGKMEQLRLS